MSLDLIALKESIKRHESDVPHPYVDSLGLWTVGIGTLIDDMLIPTNCHTIGDVLDYVTDRPRQLTWFADMVIQATKDAERFIGSTWGTMTDQHQRLVAELAYQLGLPRLEQFVKFRLALVNKDFVAARQELLNSQLAKQTPQRAADYAAML